MICAGRMADDIRAAVHAAKWRRKGIVILRGLSFLYQPLDQKKVVELPK
jgi:hypothetical protein